MPEFTRTDLFSFSSYLPQVPIITPPKRPFSFTIQLPLLIPPPSPQFRMQYGESEREMASFRKVLHAGRTILFSLPHFHEILRLGKIWVFGIGGYYPNVTKSPVSFDLKR